MPFNATALKGHTLRTDRGFLVFNEGKEVLAIPDEYRDRLVREGVIAGEGGAEADEAGEDFDGLTKADLRKLADANNVEIETDANKTTMIEKLRAAGVSAPSSDAPPA